jgi:hypothetical protein
MLTELFFTVFNHSVSVCREGLTEYKVRYRRLRKKKVSYFFYRLGSVGFVLYILILAAKPASLFCFRKGIVDDHTSGPIKDALLRSGVQLENEKQEVRVSHLQALDGFFSLVKAARAACTQVKPENVVEFVRCVQIAKYAMDYYGYFKKNEVKYVLIADTFNPKRQALGLVAEIISIPVYSFSVIKTGVRAAASFKVDTYFCWTKEHRDLLLSTTDSRVLLLGSSVNGSVRGPLPENAVYGLLLNAKYIEENIRIFLAELKTRHGIKNIQVRPHPGHKKELSLDNGILRDWREPLNEYFKSVDCVFAPNTNAMAEALLNGVPVVYVNELGEGAYDMHGLVAKNLVFPYEDKYSIPEDVNRFFEEKKTKDALASFLSDFEAESSEDSISLIKFLI